MDNGSLKTPRQGWAESFKNAEAETVFGEGISNQFDEEEWEWELEITQPSHNF